MVFFYRTVFTAENKIRNYRDKYIDTLKKHIDTLKMELNTLKLFFKN
jgi:hypothetical protein